MMMLKKQIITLLLCLIMVPFLTPAQNVLSDEPVTEPGILILKFKEQYRSVCQGKSIDDPRFQQCLSRIGGKDFRKIFPNNRVPVLKDSKSPTRLTDLSLICEISYESTLSQSKAIQILLASGMLEYAEPRYRMQPHYIPNDEKLNQQYYLNTIHAFGAWDSCQGDTSVVIGIVDSGTDWDHEDLIANISYNYDDPVDGIDNDNDSWVDNFRGWDLGENDNNPQVAPGGGNSAHGVHICGLAAASVNNGVGIAGTGFRCRFLPVKVADAAGNFVRPFEGIVYAADHGCKVINCSWGAPYTAGQFGLDIINYAVYNCGAVVVASARNRGNR